MPGNDFEKNVQQKMDELKLRPSTEVWEQVEARIREEKKSRRIFFWLLFPALLVGGGITFFILTQQRNDKIAEHENISLPEKRETILKQENIDYENDINHNLEGSKTDKSDIGNSEEIYQEKNIVNNKKNIKSQKETKATTDKVNPLQRKFQANTDRKNISKNKNDEQISAAFDDNKNEINRKNDLIQTDKKKDSVSIQKAEIKKTDSLKATEKLETDNPFVSVDDKESSNKEKNISDKKIKWGLSVQAGRSYTPQGSDLLNFQSASYAYASPQAGSGSGSSNTSILKPGLSFGLGLFARQKLSDRWDLNVGLSYSYLSTRTVNLGNRIDSAGQLSSNVAFDSYYRASGNSSYTNQYHFTDISVLLSWNILRKKKFQLNWENGVYYNRLLASNALHYSGSLRGFYKDFDQLTKNHFSISTGVTIPVINNGKIRMEVNPFASYSLTPVLRNNSDSSSNTHFTNYGLRLKFLLNKKK